MVSQSTAVATFSSTRPCMVCGMAVAASTISIMRPTSARASGNVLPISRVTQRARSSWFASSAWRKPNSQRARSMVDLRRQPGTRRARLRPRPRRRRDPRGHARQHLAGRGIGDVELLRTGRRHPRAADVVAEDAGPGLGAGGHGGAHPEPPDRIANMARRLPRPARPAAARIASAAQWRGTLRANGRRLLGDAAREEARHQAGRACRAGRRAGWCRGASRPAAGRRLARPAGTRAARRDPLLRHGTASRRAPVPRARPAPGAGWIAVAVVAEEGVQGANGHHRGGPARGDPAVGPGRHEGLRRRRDVVRPAVRVAQGAAPQPA